MTRLLASYQPPLCPDAIELCGDLVLLASYQLDAETGRKCGELALLRVAAQRQDDAPAQLPAWRPVAAVACGAVFDAKWQPGSPAGAPQRLASAEAGGARVTLWALAGGGGQLDDAGGAPSLGLLAACDLAPGEPGASALSLDFVQPGAGALLVGRSDGRISVCDVTPTGVRETGSWAAHSLGGSPIEVWTVAAGGDGAGGGGGGGGGGGAAWSGGDDGALKGWDLRTGGAGARPTFVSTAHGAGVTHVAWHPHAAHVVATGSYDESVRVWDARATGRGPLSAHATGGGAWRLRWHPHASRPELLAVACMYNGAQLLSVPAAATGAAAASDAQPDGDSSSSSGGGGGGGGSWHQLAHHTAHASITYAIEWLGRPVLPHAEGGGWQPSCDAIGACENPGDGAGGRFALASCSFYDRTLHLWEPG